jgi:hypothetical protein
MDGRKYQGTWLGREAKISEGGHHWDLLSRQNSYNCIIKSGKAIK